MMQPVSEFEAAIDAHDDALNVSAVDVWIGAEPTFTLRTSESPEWLSEALGETKQGYALRILQRLQQEYPGSLVLRTIGRQYRDERWPRWSLGLYRRRDGMALADGIPVDPLTAPAACSSEQMDKLRLALLGELEQQGWFADSFETAGELGLRVLFRLDGERSQADPQRDPRLARPSLHDHPIPLSGAVDDLAAEGQYLVALGCGRCASQRRHMPCIEIPSFPDVASFLVFIRLVSAAAAECGLHQLIWRGYSPPVDQAVAWTTLTPDPAVVEINAAPATNAREFLESSRILYQAAEAEGLAAYRLHYNGDWSDSGGGGQFTLGGPSPERSPFFEHPQLLPRLIRYLVRHPALSYWFAPVYVGSFSQSPRPDENVRESFSELGVALQQLENSDHPQPDYIWRCLSPFLVDIAGNAHRSELNIEKLWNPYLPGRGCLGLVEFRAFSMPASAESAVAIAALLRAMVAMLSQRDVAAELINWGRELHDRFALPFYLKRDLRQVLEDLQHEGFGLGEPLARSLLARTSRLIGHIEIGNCRLEVDRAIEFWPLLGDAASQDAGSSRLVDASTTRIQIGLRPLDGNSGDLDGWQLLAGGYRIPLRAEQDRNGVLRVMGLRYRSFVPWIGLHPGIGQQAPVSLMLVPPAARQDAVRVTLHEWQPQALPYEGLPLSLEEAANRRAERFVVERVPACTTLEMREPPAEAISDYCVDLRRCAFLNTS